MENYSLLCNELCRLLRKTRYLSDLKSLTHTVEPSGTRTVTAEFDGGYKKEINVTADSGWAMLMDIMRGLGRG